VVWDIFIIFVMLLTKKTYIMKIKKQGDYFKAYDENKKSLGSISIKTGRFSGNTKCLVELTNHLRDYERKELTKRLSERDCKFSQLDNTLIECIGLLKYGNATVSVWNDCFFVNDNNFAIDCHVMLDVALVQRLYRKTK
jgi:hypothetical protein